jgi:hypothetical protein
MITSVLFSDCASVMIAGSGNDTLDHLPDMFVGDLTIAGHINQGECRTTLGYAVVFPDPGAALTITEVPGVIFKEPTPGKCYAKGSKNKTATVAQM